MLKDLTFFFLDKNGFIIINTLSSIWAERFLIETMYFLFEKTGFDRIVKMSTKFFKFLRDLSTTFEIYLYKIWGDKVKKNHN